MPFGTSVYGESVVGGDVVLSPSVTSVEASALQPSLAYGLSHRIERTLEWDEIVKRDIEVD